MREELPALHLIPCFRRITPACAGRTTARRRRGWSGRDHPRVCGKNFFRGLKTQINAGSPPRVREELIYRIGNKFGVGITPACAGRTVKKSPFYAFSFSNLFMNPFTFVASSLRISTFVLLCSFFFSPIP